MTRFALTRYAALAALTLTVAPLARAQSAAPTDVAPPETSPTPTPQALPECPPGEAPPAEAMQAPAPAAPAPVPPPHHERRHNIVFAPQDISLVTGAGPSNYFGSPLSLRTDVGAGWDARLTFGAHSIFAFEAGYVGASNSVEVMNGSPHVGQITSNGLDGTLRLQLPTRVQPYIFGGIGYNHMSVNREGNPVTLATFNHSDEQFTVPAGGGVSAYLGRHATLDLRGTYRMIGNNDITIADQRALHQWVAQARIGYTF
jgi:opacity protein-like surface antigen